MKASKRNDRTIQQDTRQPPKRKPLANNTTRTNRQKAGQGFMALVVSLSIVVILTIVVAITLSSEKSDKLKPTGKGLDFTLVDTEGKTHNLSDYLGKPVLLDFSASWCNPCRAQMPAIIKLYSEFRDKMQFFTIDHIQGNETVEKAFEFKSEEGIVWPLLLDKTGDVYAKYKISGIPAIMLLDGNGNIYHQQTGNKGDLMYTEFKNVLEQMLGGK